MKARACNLSQELAALIDVAVEEGTVGEGEAWFVEFVRLRSPGLQRTAWLLTGDWASAQDLVQLALLKLWTHRDQVRRRDAPEAYLRRVMLTTFLGWRRRRWTGELPLATVPEHAAVADAFDEADVRAGGPSSSSPTPPPFTGPVSPSTTVAATPSAAATPAPADYSGSGTAQGCAPITTTAVVTIILDPDVPLPGCVTVTAGQRLEVVNSMIAVLHGAARTAELTVPGFAPIRVPVGQAVLLDRPVGAYLAPGQHFLRYGPDAVFDVWLR